VTDDLKDRIPAKGVQDGVWICAGRKAGQPPEIGTSSWVRA